MPDPIPNNKDRLLADLYAQWEHGPVAGAARMAARTLRRRRRTRRAIVGAAAVVVIALFWTNFFAGRLPAPGMDRVATATALEIISDAELLTLLRDRPILAIRDRGGIAAIVWLDPSEPDRNEN